MKTTYQLTEENVKIYRALYYGHYKPLVKEGFSEGEIRAKLKPILAEFGWSWRVFEDFKSIDLAQRFAFEYSYSLVLSGKNKNPIHFLEAYRAYDPNQGALRLKDNSLSEDPDSFH